MHVERAAAGCLVAIHLASVAPTASAAVMVKLDSISAAGPSYPGNFRWKYTASATSTDGCTERFGFNVFFTIYDLPATITTATAATAFWGASGSSSGKTPDGLSPIDDPNINNLTFTYQDLSDRPCEDAFESSAFFEVIMPTSTPVFSQYGWQTYSAYPIVDGVLQGGLGVVADGLGDNGTVPEPGTLALIGLAGLAALRRRKR